MAEDPIETEEEEFQGDPPKASRYWLAQIEDAERAFDDYQKKADSLDKLYANLNDLAATGRDRQFQMFWANIQVLGPLVYSRPPVPVVVPRFKDRRPVPRMASELLERCTVVGFETEDIDSVMRLVRDDLTVLARGCAWVRYDTKDGQRVCIEHADRKDFLTSKSRYWSEVDWVAKASYLSRKEMRKRFAKKSDKAYRDAAYEKRRDDDGIEDSELKAKVWELWCKSKNTVVWVTEGVDVVLDQDEPHLKLEGFFPCPRPAYSTVQRRSLVPVPDMLFYKDQLEEINELTARIAALSSALQVRGFYPAGAGELGDAIEAAIKSTANNQVLMPISNWSLMGGGSAKDTIVWLPIDQIATTIVQLVELRKQLIADVYEITGLSDIMRGSTEASETLGAQELKSNYGSVRIKDRQNELVRFALDLVRIEAEIMAENFSQKTMLEMSQLEIETDAEIAKKSKAIEDQIKGIIAKVENAKSDPQMMQQAQANPEAAQQMLQQAQQQAQGLKGELDKLKEVPTIEMVMKLLRDQRLRPFVLDIETDSTIAPDENAQKQRATEYLTAMGGLLAQAVPSVQTLPQIAPLVADTIRFAQSQFRVGRQMDQTVEEFVEAMKSLAGQPKPPDPAQAKAAAEAEASKAKAQSDAQTAQADAAEKAANAQKIAAETQSKAAQDELNRRIQEQEAFDAATARAADLQAKQELSAQQIEQNREKHAQVMDIGAQQLLKASLEVERIKLEAMAPGEPAEAAKAPSESISFKDLPPEGQAQMAQQAGINISPEAMQAHADTQDQKKADELNAKLAAKPKATEPA